MYIYMRTRTRIHCVNGAVFFDCVLSGTNVQTAGASQGLGPGAASDVAAHVFPARHADPALASPPTATAVHSVPDTDEARHQVVTAGRRAAALRVPVAGKHVPP